MTDRFVICDQGNVQASLVPLRLLDRPGLCPGGIYETILVRKGKPLDWELHWRRLLNGCAFLELETEQLSRVVTAGAVTEMADAQELGTTDARLRIEVFREAHQLDSGEIINFLAALWPAIYTKSDSICVAVGRVKRRPGDHRYNYKLLGRSYVEEELDAAALRHCGDVIYLNDSDELCEAAYSNIWLVKGDLLMTPPLSSPCLPGITREKILHAASTVGFAIEQDRSLTLSDVSSADALFLSSSIRGIQAVDSLEDGPILTHSAEVTRVVAASLVASLF